MGLGKMQKLFGLEMDGGKMILLLLWVFLMTTLYLAHKNSELKQKLKQKFKKVVPKG